MFDQNLGRTDLTPLGQLTSSVSQIAGQVPHPYENVGEMNGPPLWSKELTWGIWLTLNTATCVVYVLIDLILTEFLPRPDLSINLKIGITFVDNYHWHPARFCRLRPS
jgi:hypothetical protein